MRSLLAGRVLKNPFFSTLLLFWTLDEPLSQGRVSQKLRFSAACLAGCGENGRRPIFTQSCVSGGGPRSSFARRGEVLEQTLRKHSRRGDKRRSRFHLSLLGLQTQEAVVFGGDVVFGAQELARLALGPQRVLVFEVAVAEVARVPDVADHADARR
jgi:hypothetical protein